MKMEDMILVSLDDHIEPSNMYDRHLTATPD
jgi:hypothetical protein